MIILLSPSKTLDMQAALPAGLSLTMPAFLSDSEMLIKAARRLSIKKLQELMDISDKLARLNHDRFRDFHTPFTPKNAAPCLFAFQGDVYAGLEAGTMTTNEINYAQTHLRILSGLYGLLRPLDLMQAYRLEMGIPLATRRGKTLYSFWGKRITDAINEASTSAGSTAIVNLASVEYFKAIQPRKLETSLITPLFKEKRSNQYQTIALFAKKARGTMARWMIKNKVESADSLRDFAEDGYGFEPKISKPGELVFTR